MNQQPALCFGETQGYIFNFANVPDLILFSHVPSGIAAILLALFVFVSGYRHLPNKVLAISLLFFTYWVFANIVIWGTNRSDINIFLWSLQLLFEPMVYFGIFYLVYLLSYKYDVTTRTKFVCIALFIPLFIIVPTKYGLPGFNLEDCIPIESYYSFYTYVLEFIAIIGIIILSLKRFTQTNNRTKRTKIVTLMLGSTILLVTFGAGNIIGSITGEWERSQFGLLGMPIFAGVITYMVVRFQVFNAKLFGAQALILALIFLLGSQFLTLETLAQRIISGGAFLLSCTFGFLLIRSVKKEVESKEELQNLALQLKKANKDLKKLDQAKSDFISIASHQLRTPLTAIKGYLSLITEGTYGAVSPEVNGAITKISKSNERIIQLVEDLLNISRIESGRMHYSFKHIDISTVVKELKDTFINRAKERNLKFTIDIPEDPVIVHADQAKIREVISNLVDNAIKYTEEGFVKVAVTKENSLVKIAVSDSGIGIPEEVMSHLFAKFSRGNDQSRLHVDGTGLGLYVGMNITKAHHGQIKVVSDGAGDGATFIVELPTVSK